MHTLPLHAHTTTTYTLPPHTHHHHIHTLPLHAHTTTTCTPTTTCAFHHHMCIPPPPTHNTTSYAQHPDMRTTPQHAKHTITPHTHNTTTCKTYHHHLHMCTGVLPRMYTQERIQSFPGCMPSFLSLTHKHTHSHTHSHTHRNLHTYPYTHQAQIAIHISAAYCGAPKISSSSFSSSPPS